MINKNNYYKNLYILKIINNFRNILYKTYNIINNKN